MLSHHLGINRSPPIVESCPHHLNTCALPCARCFLVCYSILEVMLFIKKFRELPECHEAIHSTVKEININIIYISN